MSQDIESNISLFHNKFRLEYDIGNSNSSGNINSREYSLKHITEKDQEFLNTKVFKIVNDAGRAINENIYLIRVTPFDPEGQMIQIINIPHVLLSSTVSNN